VVGEWGVWSGGILPLQKVVQQPYYMLHSEEQSTNKRVSWKAEKKRTGGMRKESKSIPILAYLGY
jgi:hypothetical protein